MEQRNCKRDEQNQHKHQKQAILKRKAKKKSFLCCEKCNKHLSNNIKNNGANKPIKR